MSGTRISTKSFRNNWLLGELWDHLPHTRTLSFPGPSLPSRLCDFCSKLRHCRRQNNCTNFFQITASNTCLTIFLTICRSSVKYRILFTFSLKNHSLLRIYFCISIAVVLTSAPALEACILNLFLCLTQ